MGHRASPPLHTLSADNPPLSCAPPLPHNVTKLPWRPPGLQWSCVAHHMPRIGGPTHGAGFPPSLPPFPMPASLWSLRAPSSPLSAPYGWRRAFPLPSRCFPCYLPFCLPPVSTPISVEGGEAHGRGRKGGGRWPKGVLRGIYRRESVPRLKKITYGLGGDNCRSSKKVFPPRAEFFCPPPPHAP